MNPPAPIANALFCAKHERELNPEPHWRPPSLDSRPFPPIPYSGRVFVRQTRARAQSRAPLATPSLDPNPSHQPHIAGALLCSKSERAFNPELTGDPGTSMRTLPANPSSGRALARQTRARAQSRAHQRPPNIGANPSSKTLERARLCAPKPSESSIQSSLATYEHRSEPVQPTHKAGAVLCTKPERELNPEPIDYPRASIRTLPANPKRGRMDIHR